MFRVYVKIERGAGVYFCTYSARTRALRALYQMMNHGAKQNANNHRSKAKYKGFHLQIIMACRLVVLDKYQNWLNIVPFRTSEHRAYIHTQTYTECLRIHDLIEVWRRIGLNWKEKSCTISSKILHYESSDTLCTHTYMHIFYITQCVYIESSFTDFSFLILPIFMFWYQENIMNEEVAEFLAGNLKTSKCFFSLCLDFRILISEKYHLKQDI